MEVERPEPETYAVILFGPAGQRTFARYRGAHAVGSGKLAGVGALPQVAIANALLDFPTIRKMRLLNMEPLWTLLLLPLGLGLLGFIEPCSIGASLLFLKSVEGNPPAVKVMQATVFTLTRSLFIGALGALAALIGAEFLGFQGFGYVLVGTLYIGLGIVYLSGNAGRLMRSFGPSLSGLSTVRGSVALAMFFGLNIPACSGPLLAAVLGAQPWAGPRRLAKGSGCSRCSGLPCRSRC